MTDEGAILEYVRKFKTTLGDVRAGLCGTGEETNRRLSHFVARLARRLVIHALRPVAAQAPALAALLLLAACAQPAPEPPAETYTRVPAAVAANDTNVYSFDHAGPNSLGTLAVTARPTAGPNAAPAGTLAGEAGRSRAEAAVAFYGSNELCDGAAFRLASEAMSQYDPARNAWTVFGRCAGA